MKDVFYQSGDKQFTNSLHFWNDITSNSLWGEEKPFHFHLYDDQFSKADWTVEPNESFEQLCALRAKDIRNKYSYVRLWYTAGRDSHHILKTFLDNDLRIDELIIMDFSIMPRFSSDSIIAYNTAVKIFNNYNKPLPKFVSFKTGEDQYNQYFHKDYFLEYSGFGSNYNFNINQYGSIHSAFPELTRNKNNVCEVFGYEKSKIHLNENGRFYFQMYDKNFVQGLGDSDNLEWFYLSGDHPKIAIKQAHMIKTFAENYFGEQLTKGQLQSFQEHKHNYDLFATILNRGEAISNQTGGGINKTFGFYSNQYKEIFDAAKIGNWPALTHYRDFQANISVLSEFEKSKFWDSNNNSFYGVPTIKYYIS